MKTLLLMRHAKSDWGADYGNDHERPLNERGIRSAKLIGRLLAATADVPDLTVTSTALRARSTAEIAIEAGSWETLLVQNRELYSKGPEGVLEIARAAPDDTIRQMLIGHDPTWSLLAGALAGGQQITMKTAAVAIFDLDVTSWVELAIGAASLRRHILPREYFGSEWDS